MEVSVNHDNYISLGTNYGELKWPGNTFEAGEYNLIFRGISSSGAIISCDPSSIKVTIQNQNSVPPSIPVPAPLPPSPNPVPAPSPNPGSDRDKSEYSSLVKTGYSGYRDSYNPATKIVYEGSDALLTTSHNDLRISKVKIFVPPGTRLFTASFLTYLGSEESKAAGRFGEVPVSTAANVTAATMMRNTTHTLERLMAGEELPFYSPGGSGNLGISEPYQFDTFKASKGGYIYINVMSVPGGVIKTLQTRMTVDETCYRSWYANAKWDSQGNPDENATHTCAGSK